MTVISSIRRLIILTCLIFVELHRALSQENCISDIALISFDERLLTDVSAPRTYVICPGTRYTPGALLEQSFEGDRTPLIVRSNAIVKCGDDGSSTNNCTIDGSKGGAFGANVAPLAMGFPEAFAVGVVFQGITFDSFTATFNFPYPIISSVLSDLLFHISIINSFSRFLSN